ncbi:MAG: polysaccharide deacetylase family protein [Bilophila wadsworthia]
MSAYSLPVLMYHYVSRFPGAIAVSPEHFEDQCRGMAEHGWRGIGLDEAEAFLLKGAPLPPRSLLITFDDGYLDNYVYAWPILRKYGHKGVVFAVTERMEAEKKCRPTLAEVWEGLPPSSLPPVDAPMHDTPFGYQVRRDMFFSWEEARHMESSGIMAVAAHSARHLAVFAGPEWGPVNRHDRYQKPASALAAGQRFHVPGTRANTFNAVDFPEVWACLASKNALPVQPGIHPFPDLVAAAAPRAARTGGGPYFLSIGGKYSRAETLVAGFSPDRLGTLESEAARRSRVHEELGACAETLRRELGHPVRSLCWPWGSGSEVAREEGRKAGFSVFFTTRMGANPPAAPEAVHRFKVRDAGWSWLRLRLEIYSRPWLARLYGACRI